MCCAAVHWINRRQTTVAKSTGVAEAYAASDAIEELQLVVHLLDELGMRPASPIDMFVDNAAVHFNGSNSTSRRMKHTNIRFAMVRAAVSNELVNPQRVQSSDNVADVLTKWLTKAPHAMHSSKMLGEDLACTHHGPPETPRK